MRFLLNCLAAGAVILTPMACLAEETKPPQVGDTAADFTLDELDGQSVTLSKQTAKGPVVLVVLRGWPGYQCPICTRQVGQFLGNAKKFRDLGATVLFVYPGPAEGLGGYAKEFVARKTLPDGFHLLVDPDFKFTKAYNLRWDAPRETAYPSTFVIGNDGKIAFAETSKTHGGRTAASDVLDVTIWRPTCRGYRRRPRPLYRARHSRPRL